MFRRPQPSEREDDLLNEQEQFLASRQGPAATVVRRPDKRKALHDLESKKEEAEGNAVQDMSGVLSDVKEKDIQHFCVVPPAKRCAVAFPKVLRIDKQMLNDSSQPQSLFARQMLKHKQQRMDVEEDNAVKPEQTFGYQSALIDGSGLRDVVGSMMATEIHEENVKQLSSMTENEILGEQQQLLQTIDPKLLSFLKQKRKKDSAAVDKQQIENTSKSSVGKKNDGGVGSLEKASDVHNLLSGAAVNEDSLPIKPSEAKKWPHMDKVEKDKLAWTSNLPPLKPVIPKEGYSARFDFEGMLVSREQDIPTTKGLHHHGEEPEVPGYTLEELFQYSRSSVVQQRVLGLQVLTNILKVCKNGVYDKCLQTSLLPQLLDAGIVMILRWALDDNTEASVTAAVLALAAVFGCEPDEKSLDHVFSWYRGYEAPLLLPRIETDDQSSEEKMQELTDAEIMKLDAVKGLLRMDILPRFAYIMEEIKPPPEAIFAILQLLTCIARHSVDGSIAILKNTKLMQGILTNFLPKNWLLAVHQSKPVGNVYGIPLYQAVKLVRVLAASGRSVATNLVYKYRVVESIMCYISIDPSDSSSLPAEEALYLGLESYRAWRILLLYGLGAEEYLEMFPLLMRQLHYYQIAEVSKERRYDCDYGSELLGLLEAAVQVAGSQAFLSATSTGCSGDHVVPPPINWSHVASLQQPIQLCAAKHLALLIRQDKIEYWELKFTSSCLNFLSTYLSEFSKQSFFQVVEVLQQIESFYAQSIIPFCRSSVFSMLLQKISCHSSLLSTLQSGCERDPSTLGSLGSLTWGGELHPVLHPASPVHFLTALLNLIITLNKLHRSLDEEIPRLFLMSPDLVAYTSQVGHWSSSLVSDWWARYEMHFIWHLIKLASVKCNDPKVLQHFHHVAIGILPKLLVGDGFLIHDLMSAVVFSTDFLPEQHDLDIELRHLSLTSSITLKSATMQAVNTSRVNLISQTLKALHSIRTTYITVFEAYVKNVRSRNGHIPYHCDHIVIRNRCANILPADWMFLPVKQLFQKTKSSVQSSSDILSSGELLQLMHCLQWFHLLVCWKPMLTSLPISLKLYHLGCIFLISSDAFLDTTIHGYLQALLHDALQQSPADAKKETKLYISEKISFRDFYLQLLTQYEAVSYGDQLFGTFVLLPLQQRFDSQLRSDLWSEHQEALRFLSLTPQQFPMPLESYLYPLEENEQLILAYCQALFSGLVIQQRCPLLYLVAVHHIHNYLNSSNQADMGTKLKILEQISKHSNQSLCQHLLHYAQPEVESQLGFALLPKLPNNIRNLTDRIPRP